MEKKSIKMPRDEFNKMVGLKIQEARIKAGYPKPAPFAEKLGIKPDTYRKYESGAIGLSLETAWIIADELELTLDDLVGRDIAHKLVISDNLDPFERMFLQRLRDLEPADKIEAFNRVDYFIVSLEEGGSNEEKGKNNE